MIVRLLELEVLAPGGIALTRSAIGCFLCGIG